MPTKDEIMDGQVLFMSHLASKIAGYTDASSSLMEQVREGIHSGADDSPHQFLTKSYALLLLATLEKEVARIHAGPQP